MAKRTVPPTADEVRRLFDYDPRTGILTNKIRRNARAMVGEEAGTIDAKGYRCVHIDRKMYFSHRIIWAWVYGEWPKQTLDHINRNRLDNRIVNLREADHGLQMRNSRILKGNTSGVKGVHWENGRNRWRASMHWDKKVVCLGYFRTKADAIATRHAAMIERFGVDYDT